MRLKREGARSHGLGIPGGLGARTMCPLLRAQGSDWSENQFPKLCMDQLKRKLLSWAW